MTNVEKLQQKLQELQVTNLKLFKGEKWNDITIEQRAEEILKLLEALENGDCEEAVGFDD